MRISHCLLACLLSAIANPPPLSLLEGDLAEARRLVAEEKYELALALLREGTPQSDLYPCDCDDAPHYHRSSERRLAIVDCLLKLDREGEARKELRALYEHDGDPAYVIPGHAHIRLIELETQEGYGRFYAWAKEHCPATPGYEDQSIEHVAGLKQRIESGTCDGAARILGGIATHNVFTAPRRLNWRICALASYFKENPRVLPYLIRQTETERDGLTYDVNRGAVYCIGEMRDPRAIPALRKAQAVDRNYYTQLEILLARAKCGDRHVAAELYQYRGGNLANKQHINRLLRDLMRKDFGDIHTDEEAAAVFQKWAEALGLAADS